MCRTDTISDEADNCRLSSFPAGCVEVVDYAAAGAEVDWMSHPALTEDASLEVAGLGYWECSDGTVYWAVIATGTADASTPKDTPATTPAATTEEASPEPVEVVESTPEMAAPAPTLSLIHI